jgi:hypothetical protein
MPSVGSRRAMAFRSAALLVLAVLAVSACGGTNAGDYRAEAAKICRDAAKGAQSVQPPTRATREAIADYFRRLGAVSRRTSDSFTKLKPPKELKAAHDQLLRANRQAGDEVGVIVDRVSKGDDPRKVLAAAQTQVGEATAAAREAAKRLKVPECTA